MYQKFPNPHNHPAVYQPRAEIIHFEGVTGGTDFNKGYKQYQVRNQKVFREKWIMIEYVHKEAHHVDFLCVARLHRDRGVWHCLSRKHLSHLNAI